MKEQMKLTEDEKIQINRILTKTKKIKAKDPKYEVFGSKTWKYKWPKCAAEKDIVKVEKKYGIELPREYRLYLRFIANGGPGFAYGIYPIERASVPSNIKKDCTCFPFMTQEDFEILEKRQNEIYEADENSEEDIFCNGLLAIGTEGCTYDICLVVTGDYRGRIVHADMNEDGPFRFSYDDNFLDWYERWLDDFIYGLDMGKFGGSIGGSQEELCKRFSTESNETIKYSIIYSLGRFPEVTEQTEDLLKNICQTDLNADLCYIALWNLIHKKISGTFEIMQYLFNSDEERRDVCINLLRFASRNGVDIEIHT